MTSDRDKCGLSSLIPMSCRGRAAAFARRLQSRLSSLGTEDGNGSADESSWLAANENPIAISQPRHTNDTDRYFDFGVLESPGSPEDEIGGNELENLINKDNFKHSDCDDCHCSATKERKIPLLNSSVKTTSNDSDSDGPFYDTENDLDHKCLTNCVNGINGSENNLSDSESETRELNSHNTDELYATSSECTVPPQSSSISEDVSTLSLKDDDCSSLEINGSLPDLPKQIESVDEISEIVCEVVNDKIELVNETETYRSCLNIDKDLTVECPDSVQLVENEEEVIEIKIKDELNLEDNDNHDDENDEDERSPRVRRCSSLKTGKTPPGTPGSKKIVRFADVLGLDLADVRTFLDEIPKVPNSAYHDLREADLNDDDHHSNTINNSAAKFHGIKVDKVLLPLFQQPGGQPHFLDKVRDHLVCLENALVEDPSALSITGTVRVRNLDFHKSVHIRYTLNSWHSFADVKGVYLENSCDGFSDKFSFLIYAHTLTVGQRLEFAVRFQCKGAQYWDNNNGVNYCFQCLPASNSTPYSPITGMDDTWGASFY